MYRSKAQRSKAWLSLGALSVAMLAAFALSAVGSADTTATPGTTTRAVLNPNPATGCNPTPPTQAAAPCATHTNGTASGGAFSGASGGDKLSIHIDGSAGTFFGTTRTTLCRASLTDVELSAQLVPSNGDCIPAGASGMTGAEPTNGNHSAGGSSPPNTYVDYTYSIGEGTYTPPGGTPITCDASNPCQLWIQESVSNSDDQSGYIFKHFTINYAGGGGPTTTTTSGPTTTTTTRPTTTTTSGPTTTTTTGPTTTTTVAPTTSTTTESTTSTSGPVATTSTTTPSGASVSPSSAPPGQPINVQSSGWMPCGGGTTTTSSVSTSSTTACPAVTVTFESDPITLGTLTPDGTGTVSGQFNVPASAVAGSHTIVLSGTGANGAALTVSIPFTVTATSGGGSANNTTGGAAGSSGGGTTSSTPLALTGTQLRAFWFGITSLLTGLLLLGASRRRKTRFGR